MSGTETLNPLDNRILTTVQMFLHEHPELTEIAGRLEACNLKWGGRTNVNYQVARAIEGAYFDLIQRVLSTNIDGLTVAGIPNAIPLRDACEAESDRITGPWFNPA